MLKGGRPCSTPIEQQWRDAPSYGSGLHDAGTLDVYRAVLRRRAADPGEFATPWTASARVSASLRRAVRVVQALTHAGTRLAARGVGRRSRGGGAVDSAAHWPLWHGADTRHLRHPHRLRTDSRPVWRQRRALLPALRFANVGGPIPGPQTTAARDHHRGGALAQSLCRLPSPPGSANPGQCADVTRFIPRLEPGSAAGSGDAGANHPHSCPASR